MLKKEIKTGLKPFIYWMLLLVLFIVSGISKYSGVKTTETADLLEFLESFPNIVLAVFGMPHGIDLTTLSGYYEVLTGYLIIVICLYAIYCAVSAVTTESIDKTYEFIFTKPISRTKILSIKLLNGFLYTTLFCVFNYLITVLCIPLANDTADISFQIMSFSITSYVLALAFFAVSVLISVLLKKSSLASIIANSLFVVTYFMKIVSDSVDEPEKIRLLSPLRFFPYQDVLDETINVFYIILCLIIIIAALLFAFKSYKRKDLI